ncbi:ABC transporter ATP-binding protein [Oxalicibacterium flavum]|uniref:ABC transporter ATP-binding protein n=1 Tax=Oxalicibacterium flavum TaxID=179467 RepID=A0A8J2ULA9_9BURK|nr:ABC transporter ATP-binding protein [Oxalicibacterium flavum]GGC00808.1 ABC transporter ATP-binding protein [Oxalicibacterium flavum]
MSALLEIEDLQAWYGKSHVLRGVGLRIERGEIVGLLGRNGSGRSTLVKAVMGQVQASGSVLFRGEQLLGLPTSRIARAGIGYVAENRDIFPTLTVAQNLTLGVQRSRPGRWSLADALRLFPQLEARMQVAAGVLSGGEQQMLALARAMMGNPELMLIDEPTEGLAPQLVAAIAVFLEELASRGTAVLLIEQKLAIALAVSQRIYLLGHGRVVHHGAPDSLRTQPELSRDWLAV